MKTRFYSFAICFLLLAVSVWGQKWTIDSFDNSPDPGDPDKYIGAESGKGLTPVEPGQVVPQEGVLYVRQKFEDDLGAEETLYQIFRGKQTEVSRKLGKIKVEGPSYQALLKMKIYYDKKPDARDDLENVYYDGKDILVEGEDPVYIFLNGKMMEFRPEVVREYNISITSEPPEAAVSLGNISRGVTPVSITLSSGRVITAVISKEGYNTVVIPITPIDGKPVQENITLTVREPLSNPATAYKAQLETAVANKDGNGLRIVRTGIMQTMSNYTVEIKKTIDSALAKLPANAPKQPNESQEDFSARRTIWTSAQDKEKNVLNKEAQDYFVMLKELLANANSALEEIDFTLRYEYIPSSAIFPSKWGVKDFSIDVMIANSNTNLKYNNARLGYGKISRNELMQNLEKIHGVLKIWDTPNENGKFTSIYDIAFFYDETPLNILQKGSYELGDATATSRTTQNDLNTRIAGYSGKVAWGKKDAENTIATLRASKLAAKAAVAQAAPPEEAEAEEEEEEAYYDEEEDEGEFEDEMDEQRRADYARSGATRSATDIFGNKDEYIFWSGVALAVAAVGTGVVGFLQHIKYSEANDAVAVADRYIGNVQQAIRQECGKPENSIPNCEVTYNRIAEGNWNTLEEQRLLKELMGGRDVTPLKILRDNKVYNEKARKDFNTSRMVWFSLAGVSAVGSVTLFLW